MQTPEEILEAADRYARFNPGIDWPSKKHANPVAAIAGAYDSLCERVAEAAEEIRAIGRSRPVDDDGEEKVLVRLLTLCQTIRNGYGV